MYSKRNRNTNISTSVEVDFQVKEWVTDIGEIIQNLWNWNTEESSHTLSCYQCTSINGDNLKCEFRLLYTFLYTVYP